MNKKFLTVILCICFMLMFILYIGAEDNLSHEEQSASIQEGIIEEISSSSIIYEDLDALIEENSSNELPEEFANQIPEEGTSSNEENNKTIETPTIETDTIKQNSNDGSSVKEELIEYIELSNITQETLTEDSEIEKEKTEYTYYVDGRKEIEIESYERIEINKEEVEKNEFEKEITISSEEHVEDPLRVYTDLTTETVRENIKIYWKNENNLEITEENEFAVEYYDENSNGLIDRISWMVPHLSEQVFDVVIETNFIDNGGLIDLSVIVNTDINPIKFYINVSYDNPTNINCSLDITQNSISIFYKIFKGINETIGSPNLQNGSYHWEIACYDEYLPSMIDGDSGDFIIDEEFSVSLTGGDLSSRLYLLDFTKNDLKSNGTINIHSQNPSKMRIEIKKDNLIYYTNDISGNITDYILPLNKNILNQSGIYNLTVYFDKPSAKSSNSIIFSVASVNLTFNTTSPIKEGDTIKITANVTSPIEQITTISLYYGDGSVSNPIQINSNGNHIREFTKRYTNEGQYTVNLTGYINTMNFEVKKGTISVTDFNDNEDPDISLLWPDDEEIIHDSIVNFSYEANDNVKLKNCTFKLYGNCASMSYCSTSSSNLDYSTTKSNPENGEEIEVKLKDFDEGMYEWLVECYDNSSNYDWEVAFFTIDFNGSSSSSSSSNYDYTQKDEVEYLKKQVDEFLDQDFSLEEQEALEDLNILNNTKYYKKRLTDIDNFLGENYKYVSSEELRQKKTNEYLAELEDLKNKIPQEISIKESYEFIKNQVDVDLEEVVRDYFASTNTKIGRSSIQRLAKVNKELQNEISVSAKIRNVEIEYANGTQKITLVKKEIKLTDEEYTQILEIIPKEIAKNYDKIFFMVDNEIIKEDPIFEIDYEDLDKKEIIYYLDGFIDLKSFENTETLLFEDDLSKLKARFTGFFVVDFASSDITLYFILAFVLLIALLFVIILVFKKFRILKWRKEPNVVRTIHLIEEIKKLLAEKEIEKAREKYYKLKEIYPLLPYETKSYFYNKIGEMLARIDKKDIFGLVKEYQEAKRNWNKEDYVRLYKDIRKIYGRLPEKDRKKVYDIINGY